MTILQKITLRLSEVRSRLNEISGLEGDGPDRNKSPRNFPTR